MQSGIVFQEPEEVGNTKVFSSSAEKAVPDQKRYDVKLVSCDWSLGSRESLICGKFNLKINRSVKTP